jgi:G3E family GTPase
MCCAMLCRAVQVLAMQQSLLTNGGCLLRSKGFVWLASCPDRVVEWSSSGLLLEVCMAHPWFVTLPEVGLSCKDRVCSGVHMCGSRSDFSLRLIVPLFVGTVT